MLLYNNRKAHLFSLSDVPIYNSILILLQAPPVTVYKPLFFYVSSTILMTAYILRVFYCLLSDHSQTKKQPPVGNPRAHSAAYQGCNYSFSLMLHLYYIKISAKNQMVNDTIHYPLRYIILPIYTTLHSSGFFSLRIALNTARRTPILSEGTYTMVQTTGLIHVAYRHPFGILKNGQSASSMLY